MFINKVYIFITFLTLIDFIKPTMVQKVNPHKNFKQLMD